MTDKYEAPFEGGKTPDPNRKAKVKNIAKNLARKAMKKAASKPVEEGYMKKTVSDDDSGMSDYEHYMQTRDPKTGLTGHQIQQRKAMDAADFKKRREEMNAKRQAGTKPLSTTYKEEVELDEASTKPKSVWQQAAIDGRKKGTELGKKTAEEFHKNVNAKGIHRGHPEHEDLYYKHIDKFSYKKLSKNFTAKGANDAAAEHASNAAHDAFHRHIDKLHNTAMKKDPAYKAKFDKNEADIKKSSEEYQKHYKAANAKIDKLRDEHRTGSSSHIEAIEKVRKEHGHEATQSALYNHYGDGDGNLPTWAGGHGTNAERARAHYNMWVAGTGGHGDRGYRYEEVELEEAKDNREYDYEGDMAMSQLKSVIANAQKLHDMLDPDTNLPEWVQSKITLAEDYIVTAANYMDGEMNEEVEQVEEGLVGSLVKAYVSPKAQALVGKSVKKVASKLGASAQTQRRLQKVGMKWAKSKIGEEVEQVEEDKKRQVEPPPSAMPSDTRLKPLPKKGKRTVGSFNKFGHYTPGMREDVEQIEEKAQCGRDKLASSIKNRIARKKLAVEAHDPVGKEDSDINNDGKVDKTDVYLHTKRRAIGKAISTRLASKAGK